MVAADMFPVRVLVETVRSQHCLGCAHDGNPVVDTFAVVGGQTMLCQLVETVLSALGLPQFIQDSKGLIQINNWKPISFETITDNPEELVTNLFREISTHITLKILAKRSPNDNNGQCLMEMKQRLLKTAIEKQPQILTSSNGQEVKEILQQVMACDDECTAWMGAREQSEAVNEWLEQIAAQQEDNRKSPLSSTRFSPVSELPRLERWFRSDPNPSRQKLISYANILNAAPYRRANNKVTYQQMCNWFVTQRRTHQRSLASRQSSAGCQQQNCGSARQQQPMAILPLNAAMPANNQQHPQPQQNVNNFALLNSLASLAAMAAASGGSANMQQVAASAAAGDPQAQQKLAANLMAHLSSGNSEGMVMLGGNEEQHRIPLASIPMDFRSKFENASTRPSTSSRAVEGRLDGESGEEQQNPIGDTGNRQPGGTTTVAGSAGQNSDRMDGGSESPTGNDDMSVHSVTSGAGCAGTIDAVQQYTSPSSLKELSSLACSPDEEVQWMDVHQTPQQAQNPDEIAIGDDEQQQQPMDTMMARQESCSSSSGACFSGALPSIPHFSHPTSSPSCPTSSSSMAAAAAAAAAAFSQLMPSAQQQLQLMAMAAGISSPPTPSSSAANHLSTLSSTLHNGHQSEFGASSSVAGGGLLKQSPSCNSLNGKEENGGGGVVKSELSNFSSPTSSHQRSGRSADDGARDRAGEGTGGTSRSRLMFDPLSELPILERWFEDNPHPGWLQIEQYTDYLNAMAYRQNYPHISTHNVKIWFKNRRAKTKRLMGGTGDSAMMGSGDGTPNSVAG